MNTTIDVESLKIERLFERCLGTLNESMAANRDRTPYGEIFAACKKLIADRHIGVAVYKDDPDTPFDYFTLRLRDGRFEMVAHGKEEPDIAWKVSRAYLERVAVNRDEYIRHPEKLDWHWLKSRIGWME